MRKPAFRSCSVAGCDGNSHHTAKGARGWCNLHWKRWRRHGDPNAGRALNGERLAWLIEHSTWIGEGCLTWPFAVCESGYGCTIAYDGRIRTPQSLMCELAHGPAPTPDHEAAHSCGRGHLACLAPGHLRWATTSENQMDRVGHGTSNRGERCANSVLSETDVRAARRAAATTSQRELAERFGVDQSTISRAVTGDTWGWLE